MEQLPSSLAARVEQIVRAAEREAAIVQRDLESQRRVAEAEAHRYLVDAKREAESMADERVGRLRDLTDDLIARAEAVRRQLGDLVEAVERATAEIRSDDARPAPPPSFEPLAPTEAPAGEGAPPFEPEPEPEPEAPLEEPQPDPAASRRRSRNPRAQPDRARRDAARLVAIEMAVAGRTRAQVDAHLDEAFRIGDRDALLDDVFGDESAGPARSSWAPT